MWSKARNIIIGILLLLISLFLSVIFLALLPRVFSSIIALIKMFNTEIIAYDLGYNSAGILFDSLIGILSYFSYKFSFRFLKKARKNNSDISGSDEILDHGVD